MSDYKKCEICEEYDWIDSHKCPPKMYFKNENWGDEWQEIHARHMRDAAIRVGKMYNDDGDYALMDDEIEVLILDGKTEKLFIVSAEASIEYHAQEKKSRNNEQ